MADIKETRISTNDQEIALIKSIFKDNEQLLKHMRSLFLGIPLTDVEKGMIALELKGEEIQKVLQRRFLPTIEKDAPIGQISDVWLGVETMIFGAQRDTIEQAVLYKEKALKMTAHALSLLNNLDGEPVDISYNADVSDSLQINLLARNQFLRHVEQQLLFLKIISEQEDESQKDKVERNKRDSTK